METKKCFVVAIHPSLELNRVTALRSFNHTFEALNDISDLAEEMIKFFDPITARQLQGCAEAVKNKKDHFSLIKMFNFELKFVIDICKKCTNEKFLKKNLALDMLTIKEYKKKIQ